MRRTQVIHIRDAGQYPVEELVYIGRGHCPITGKRGEWGNNFIIGAQGTREEVVEKHRQMLRRRPDLVAKIRRELRGRILMCYCAPRLCHGHTLARVADGGEP